MLAVEMQSVDTYPVCDVEEELLEWYIIFILKTGRQLFRLEDKPVLYEISNDKQDDSANDDI